MTEVVGRRRWLRWQLDGRDFRMAVHEWRPREPRRFALCLHGFLSSGLEFERLAEALAAAGWLVFCPDLPGYGESERLPDIRSYSGSLYRALARLLLSSSGFAEADFVGSSMGAALALRLAAESPRLVRRLVLNDGGAFAPASALARVLARVPPTVSYPTRAEAELAVRHFRSDCDALPEEDWARVLQWSVEHGRDGWLLRYDPRLVEKLGRAATEDQAQWTAWVALECPVLLVRGERSDMMTEALADRMIALKPGTGLMSVPDCGHRPWLRRREQIDPILRWLAGDSDR